jgi:hypothetical protein
MEVNMKTVAKEIEVICHFSKSNVTPLKLKYEETDSSYKVIKVDKVISKSEEKFCGNISLVYDCQSVIDGVEKIFQLKYFKSECKWVLFKI